MNERRLAIEWYQRVITVAHGHYRAALRFSRLHLLVSVPTVLLTIIVGTSVFASLQQQPEEKWKIAVGVMSILAAVFSGLQAFLGYGDKVEKHKIAGSRYNAIGRKLEHMLAKGDDWTELKDIRERIDALAQESPHIPASVHGEMVKGAPKPIFEQ
jgi:hypothetical protein